jgi:hypothetical protein
VYSRSPEGGADIFFRDLRLFPTYTAFQPRISRIVTALRTSNPIENLIYYGVFAHSKNCGAKEMAIVR